LDISVGIRIEQDDVTVKDLQVEATPEQTMPTAIALRVRLSALWPHAVVLLGAILTVAWSGSLAWLLLRLLDVI
jgi:hypothetical protein